MMHGLLKMFKFKFKPKTSHEPQLMRCDICNHYGKPVGGYSLHRPICCDPIYVCRNTHSPGDILFTFRDKHAQCAVHCVAERPEVEYIHRQK